MRLGRLLEYEAAARADWRVLVAGAAETARMVCLNVKEITGVAMPEANSTPCSVDLIRQDAASASRALVIDSPGGL